MGMQIYCTRCQQDTNHNPVGDYYKCGACETHIKLLDPLVPMRGVKHDAEKLPMDLLDAAALEGLTKVLAFGARKYAAHNWRGGFKWTRLLAALLRHTFAILRGEFTDPESNLPHIDHIGCCWMFLSNMMKTRPDLNDLYDHSKVPANFPVPSTQSK